MISNDNKPLRLSVLKTTLHACISHTKEVNKVQLESHKVSR